MSMYNALMGFNPACLLIMPMLGRKQEEYPRFRDCFISEDKKHIDIYTRVGGANRNSGYGEEELYKDENFVETFDDDFDNTYATYRFKVPTKWQKDFDNIITGEWQDISQEYINTIKAMCPKLAESGMIDKILSKTE